MTSKKLSPLDLIDGLRKDLNQVEYILAKQGQLRDEEEEFLEYAKENVHDVLNLLTAVLWKGTSKWGS